MFLEKLSNARGVSGNEFAVRALLLDHIKTKVDEVKVDALGNLIAIKRVSARRANSRRLPFRLLIAAHMDEVGFLITHINGEGRLHFEKVGGLDDRVLLSKSVWVGSNGVAGVICAKPRHLTSEQERKKVVDAEDLVIDIGANSREDAQRVVQPGDYATFATTFGPFGENLVRGKALDDRVGCAILAELLNDDFPYDLYAAFTTQEEIGLRGARVAGYRVEPDAAVVIEATICDDSPKEKDVSPTTRLGAGPALTLVDRGMLADKRWVKLFQGIAHEHHIPFQIKQPLVGGTDGGRIHLTRAGVPSAVVSVPARYIHSPAAVISLDDYHNTLRLLRAALAKLADGLPNQR